MHLLCRGGDVDFVKEDKVYDGRAILHHAAEHGGSTILYMYYNKYP